MGSALYVLRLWPALDIRLPASGPPFLLDLILASLDDFRPSAIQEGEAAGTLLRAFFNSPATRDRAREDLQEAFGQQGVLVDPVDVPDEDWAARSQAGLRAITAGRIIVAPPWDRPAVAAAEDTIAIVIQPSMGFGTGHHASTRLCLVVLQKLDLHGRRVLDIGTGSGVLAIAAVRLGADRATGIDADPDAIACARENLELNGLTRNVDLEVRDFRETGGMSAPIVLANLTGALLARWADRLTGVVDPGGYLVASGFRESEVSVLPALEAALSRVTLEREGEWLCAVLQRR